MEQLYLNNILIELPASSIALTLQLNDIGAVKNKQAGYTNSILIPETPGNLLALEMLGVNGNISRKPYQRIDARYVVDGKELISNGFAIINDTEKGYRVHIYDGNIELYSVLGDQDLNSLDWTALNHSLTIPVVEASLNNTEGYIYADGIFYKGEYGTNLNFKSPSIFVHTIFKMILEQNGYSYSGAIFDNPKFKNLVVSTKRGYDNTMNFTEVQYLTDNWFELIKDVRSSDPFENTVEIGSFICQNYEIHRLHLSVNMTIDEGEGIIEIKKNGSVFHTQVISDNIEIDVSFLANENDVITVGLRYQGTFDGVEYIAFMDVAMDVQVFGSSADPIAIDFSIMFDEEKQVSFFKEIIQQFGLIHRQKRNSKEIQFIAIKDLLNDRASADDWSDKLSSMGKESYKSGFERENNFAFKYDTLPFADGSMFVDNENLTGVKTIMSSIFTARPSVDGYEVVDHWGEDDTLVLPKMSKFRIYNLSYSDSSLTITYPNVQGSFSIAGQIPKLEQVYFKDVLRDNYSEYNDLLNSFKKVGGVLNLSSDDIYSLDFFKLKYFKQTGKYYYLNKVPGYVKGRKSKIEIIEVPNEFTLIASFNSSNNIYNDELIDESEDLGNVDNTSDINKPISEATQEALDLKLDKNLPVSAPSNLVLTENTEFVNITFDIINPVIIDRVEVWASQTSESEGFDLVGIVNKVLANNVVKDYSYLASGTIWYRVYAKTHGAISEPLTGNIQTTYQLPDPSINVVSDYNSFRLSWQNITDRRFSGVEIYYDAQAVEGDISEATALANGIQYSGLDENFEYEIKAGDEDKFHQFWIKTITEGGN